MHQHYFKMENFYNLIKTTTLKTSNNFELGSKIRSIVQKIEDENAKKLNAQKAVSNQIDLEDMINEVNNGN